MSTTNAQKLALIDLERAGGSLSKTSLDDRTAGSLDKKGLITGRLNDKGRPGWTLTAAGRKAAKKIPREDKVIRKFESKGATAVDTFEVKIHRKAWEDPRITVRWTETISPNTRSSFEEELLERGITERSRKFSVSRRKLADAEQAFDAMREAFARLWPYRDENLRLELREADQIRLERYVKAGELVISTGPGSSGVRLCLDVGPWIDLAQLVEVLPMVEDRCADAKIIGHRYGNLLIRLEDPSPALTREITAWGNGEAFQYDDDE